VTIRPRAGRRVRRPVSFSGADEELAETLDSLDGADNYARWIFDLLEPHLGPRVLEVGAGHGTFTDMLARERRVMATELSPRCIEVLRQRFVGRPEVEVLASDVSGAGLHGPYDAAVLINVLEHIDDDGQALRELASALRPGGRLILWVPAFEALYSDFDRRIGHRRRYRLGELRAKLTAAGLDPVDLRYVNSVGAVAWWVAARHLRMNPTSRRNSSLFDRFAVPVVRRVESRVRPPFGQSVFAVATRPGDRGFVLATANPDKAGEITEILGPAVPLIPRPADVDDVEETGETLLDNARLKARALSAATGRPAIADDTGLEVDGLDGAPGVYSSRYAGDGATYADNVAKLLGALSGRPGGATLSRRARFRTVAVAAWPDGREMVAEGMVGGVIATAPRGAAGFGYDPVFVPEEGDGRTFAEMSAEEKHRLSHRGRAFGALAARLSAE
jgi:XTP/dITP diphosphohydrolase